MSAAVRAAPSGVQRLRVGFVAGEHSGDQLGAALIAALRERVPGLECFGIAGPKMIAAGCEAWWGAEQLSVMGLAEVLRHLPRLLRLRAAVARRFREARPDVFVGIDAPEFNLSLARGLKRAGVRTVQYVSPQVWAWRQGRVRGIARSCDLVLCLLPFEAKFYAQHGLRAAFVGHPLADQIPLEVDREAARRALGVEAAAPLVALLPGSRLTEVVRLGAPFAAAAAHIAARRPGFRFIAPMASPAVRELFVKQVAQVPDAPQIRLLDGEAQLALAACDAALVASGTATLEALLSARPMVVAYRVSPLTAFALRTLALVKVRYFSQPNLLAGRRLVPEFFQEQVRGAALGDALLQELEDRGHVRELVEEFAAVHRTLRRGGAALAAQAILECAASALGGPPAMSAGAPMAGAELALAPPRERRARARIAGVDEAGRGPLAGPVVAAAVILDPRRRIRGLADSKLLTAQQRERLALLIRARALAFGIGWADRDEIDCLNILEATLLAMRRALLALPVCPTHVQVDGNRCPWLADLPLPCTLEAIVRGDALVAAISAASILAKVHRDAMMRALDACYPGFALARHKGYGTPAHLEALARRPPSPLHRRSFSPLRRSGDT